MCYQVRIGCGLYPGVDPIENETNRKQTQTRHVDKGTCDYMHGNIDCSQLVDVHKNEDDAWTHLLTTNTPNDAIIVIYFLNLLLMLSTILNPYLEHTTTTNQKTTCCMTYKGLNCYEIAFHCVSLAAAN